MRRLWFLIPLLWVSIASAQVGPAPGIQLQDEGTGAGRIQILNCVGAGVTCTKSGVTGTATISSSGGGITLATMQATTSGTAKDFTGIPSGTKRITVMFDGVSTNGTSPLKVQIGDAGGLEITGYIGHVQAVGSVTAYSDAFLMDQTVTAATNLRYGVLTLTLMDSGTNVWTGTGMLANKGSVNTNISTGVKPLTAELDRVRITTVNETDTFDAGNVNITYE